MFVALCAGVRALAANSPPAVVSPLPDLVVEASDLDTVIDLSAVFTDADIPSGDTLTFSVTVHTSVPVPDIVDLVTQASYSDYLDNWLYAHDGDNRGIGGPEHDLARDNILSLLGGFDLATSLDPFDYAGSTYHNVVGVLEGTSRPDDIYIVGAHYDSVSNPGADDNASGVAGVLEAARVLGLFDFEATVVFIAFDREEQGLQGSNAYAQEHQDDQILGMISLDMIAYNDGGGNQVDLYGRPASNPLKQALSDAIGLYGNGLSAVHRGIRDASDHAPFEWQGFQAVLVNEAGTNPHYHTQSDSVDTPNYLDYTFATNVTRATVGYLATAAGVQDNPDLLIATVVGPILTLDYNPADHGVVSITVRATDQADAFAEDTFLVTVEPASGAPPGPPGPLTIDLQVVASGQLNPSGPAPRSLGIVAIDPNGNPPEVLYAIQVGASPTAGWLRVTNSGPPDSRDDLYASGTEPEWHAAAEWAGKRLRGLDPATGYLFRGKASNTIGESATVDVGSYTTNHEADVNRSGLVTALDYAYIKAAVLGGGGLVWPCDVTDNGAVDTGDLAATRFRILNP